MRVFISRLSPAGTAPGEQNSCIEVIAIIGRGRVAVRQVVPYADMLAAVAPLGPIDGTELEEVLLSAIYANLIVLWGLRRGGSLRGVLRVKQTAVGNHWWLKM